MASLAVTTEWSDPSASLTADQAYIVQNKSTGVVQFFEGATFDATTNADDGILLVPMNDGGSGPNHMRWSYDSGNMVRMRLQGGGIAAVTNAVEFALAT